MQLSLQEVARLLDGELQGDGAVPIHGAATLQFAQPGQISFIEHERMLSAWQKSRASAVLAPPDLPLASCHCVRTRDVHAAFARLVELFHPRQKEVWTGVHPAAIVDPSAELADDVAVGAGAYIGPEVRVEAGCVIHSGARILAGCVLDRQCTLFPNVVLYENTRVGKRVIIHAGAVIGAYGFGYKTSQGRHHLGAQLGHVVLEDDVEIGANTTIDRGSYGPTVIGEGAKIDNLVQIGHNCRIGKHNLLCAQVGVAGSCTTGDYVVMAGQVGVGDHHSIGSQVVLGARSGVMTDIAEPGRYAGAPCRPINEEAQLVLAVSKLPEMRRQLKRLENEVARLAQAERKGADAA